MRGGFFLTHVFEAMGFQGYGLSGRVKGSFKWLWGVFAGQLEVRGGQVKLSS